MENRELAHQLIDAYFDHKDIVVKDVEYGVPHWTSIYSNEIWTYLGEFCENVENGDYYIGFGDVRNATFTYVHELQHALRICALNELANNFKIE